MARSISQNATVKEERDRLPFITKRSLLLQKGNWGGGVSKNRSINLMPMSVHLVFYFPLFTLLGISNDIQEL